MATSITNIIACNEPHASLDIYYGPYVDKEAALDYLKDVVIAGVTYCKRHVGLTIGIWNSTQTNITEWWFQGGISDTDLVEKSSEGGGGGGGDLPGNIKVVTFNKNGANEGSQNSMLTDDSGAISLPQPTIRKTNYTFAGWEYGSSVYQPEATVTVGSSTVFKAKWTSSSEPCEIKWSRGKGIKGITGMANEEEIPRSGTKYEVNTLIKLTATLLDGYDFDQWTGVTVPDPKQREITFNLTTNITAVANGKPKAFSVSWMGDNGIRKIIATRRGESVEPGIFNYGDEIKLTPELNSGFNFDAWLNCEEGEFNPEDYSLTFVVTGSIDGITATTTPVQQEWDVDLYLGDGISSVSGIDVETGDPITRAVPNGHRIELRAKVDDGYDFTKWTGSGIPTERASENPLTFQITQSVSATATATKQKETKTIKWTDGSNVIINGTYGTNNKLDNPSTLPVGTTVNLFATYQAGYTFNGWENVPGTIDRMKSNISFQLDDDYTSITASASNPQPATYQVKWGGDEGISKIDGTMDGETVYSPVDVETDKSIILKPYVKTGEGYEFNRWVWEGKPDEGEYTIDVKTHAISFTVTGPINMTAETSKSTRPEFSYYGSKDGGIATKFNKQADNPLKISAGEDGFRSLFVIVPNGYKPTSENVNLALIKEARNCEEYYNQYLEKGWLEPNTSNIKEESVLAVYGAVMYAYAGEPVRGEITIVFNAI